MEPITPGSPARIAPDAYMGVPYFAKFANLTPDQIAKVTVYLNTMDSTFERHDNRRMALLGQALVQRARLLLSRANPDAAI